MICRETDNNSANQLGENKKGVLYDERYNLPYLSNYRQKKSLIFIFSYIIQFFFTKINSMLLQVKLSKKKERGKAPFPKKIQISKGKTKMTYNYETKVSSGVIIYNFYVIFIISLCPKSQIKITPDFCIIYTNNPIYSIFSLSPDKKPTRPNFCFVERLTVLLRPIPEEEKEKKKKRGTCAPLPILHNFKYIIISFSFRQYIGAMSFTK